MNAMTAVELQETLADVREERRLMCRRMRTTGECEGDVEMLDAMNTWEKEVLDELLRRANHEV